jgi:hypothetical protein
MNAREVCYCVSAYERRRKRQEGTVTCDTLDLVRRNLGGQSVMEFARVAASQAR